MFSKFKKSKKEEPQQEKINISEKDREQIRGLLESKKLPIVILDNLWYQMKDVLSRTDISSQENNLKELLKEQGKVNTDIKEYTVVKQNLLQQVLVISEDINEKGHASRVNELEKLSKAILKVNQTLEELEVRVGEIDRLMTEVNKELIERVVLDAYSSMEVYKVKKNDLEEEIDRLRRLLVEKTEEKKQYDQAITGIYNYLHKMIGYKYLDKVDHKLGE